tara:strand:- start:131 stop:478 length:348 start_codon:yes stop_codon:yes gene_type:complete
MLDNGYIMELFELNCKELGKNSQRLDNEEISFLLKKVPGWHLVKNNISIEKKYIFPNFNESLYFINQVSSICESENHHPDILFGWGYAKINIYSHFLGGLHKNDFIIASKIDNIK